MAGIQDLMRRFDAGMAGMPKGGTVGMPHDYSRGNWKLI